MNTPDNGVGEIAFEIFIHTMKTLDSEYSIFMKAIYTGDNHEEEALMQKLERLRRMQEARKAAEGNTSDVGESICSELEVETTDSSDSIAN